MTGTSYSANSLTNMSAGTEIFDVLNSTITCLLSDGTQPDENGTLCAEIMCSRHEKPQYTDMKSFSHRNRARSNFEIKRYLADFLVDVCTQWNILLLLY